MGFFSWKIEEKRPPPNIENWCSQVFILGTPSILYEGLLYVFFVPKHAPENRRTMLLLIKTGRPLFGSVRLRFGDGTVRAVPGFGSGGSSVEKDFLCFSRV